MQLLPNKFKRTPASVKKLEQQVEILPDIPIHKMSEDQLEVWSKYLESITTEKEQKFVQLYETDPEIYGNKVRSYARAYNKDLSEGTDTNEYMKAVKASQDIWSKERVQKYKELVQFKHGNSIESAIALSQSRLVTFIEQLRDEKLSLKAISELNRILGRYQPDVAVQVNNVTGNNSTKYDYSKLDDDELITFTRLLDKCTVKDE